MLISILKILRKEKKNKINVVSTFQYCIRTKHIRCSLLAFEIKLSLQDRKNLQTNGS